jgi:hypothetical protein
MAVLVIELNIPGLSIADLNDKGGLNSGDRQDAINQAVNLAMALNGGAQAGTVQLTSRDSSASVSTSGSGSLQKSY